MSEPTATIVLHRGLGLLDFYEGVPMPGLVRVVADHHWLADLDTDEARQLRDALMAFIEREEAEA